MLVSSLIRWQGFSSLLTILFPDRSQSYHYLRTGALHAAREYNCRNSKTAIFQERLKTNSRVTILFSGWKQNIWEYNYCNWVTTVVFQKNWKYNCSNWIKYRNQRTWFEIRYLYSRKKMVILSECNFSNWVTIVAFPEKRCTWDTTIAFDWIQALINVFMIRFFGTWWEIIIATHMPKISKSIKIELRQLYSRAAKCSFVQINRRNQPGKAKCHGFW